jgi:DmsE family decaheme c-type cytochrome
MLALGAVMLCAAARSAQSGEANSGGLQATQPASSNFAGAAACASCHKDVVKEFANNPHSRPVPMPGGNGENCESCHGPGKRHAENGDISLIVNPARATAKEVDENCQSCHDAGHAGFERSAHGRGNVSCIGCHSIHSAGVPKHLLKMAQPQLCYQCHSNVKPEFSMPSRHKVEEGLIDCTDCHDPHRAFGEKTLWSSARQFTVCTKCHTATAGPFIHEHPAVTAEGCTACHFPHGGPNPQMLTEARVNTICLHCHLPAQRPATGLSAVPEHILTEKSPSCISCHAEVHGSNTSEIFLKSTPETAGRQ